MRFVTTLLAFFFTAFFLIFVPVSYADTLNVTYCNGQQMDIYSPSANATSSNPLIIQVHGGAWEEGSKIPISQMDPQVILPKAFSQLSAKGFVIASINYRLGSAGQYPNNIEDVKCAIRYMRANASKYTVDPNRIGLAGDSAGGHLVFLAGLAGSEAGWDVGDYSSTSSVVQAVAGYSSPTYLNPVEGGKFPDVWTTDTAVWDKASPITWAGKSSKPALLIVHGDQDEILPIDHATKLADAAKAGGIDVTLQVVKNAYHEMAGDNINPDANVLIPQTVNFFLSKLGTPTTTTVAPTGITPTFVCVGQGSCPTLSPSPTLYVRPSTNVSAAPSSAVSQTISQAADPSTTISGGPYNGNGNGNGNGRGWGRGKRNGWISQFFALLFQLIMQLIQTLMGR